ncbi:MAG: MetQ/NlpA family ABC transporter substrate-binding protein [Firmicutes bacterium]|nr:MetQ/NlpA family ABC transporter substrate-binding protein [Bacillota bacterium]
MRKPSTIVLLGLLTVFLAFSSPAALAATVTVGATPVPHAEILAVAAPLLEQQGITLRIMEFNDYVTPNRALAEGELDANFFQHQPYLDTYNADAGTNIVSLVGIHIEPLGVYSSKLDALADLPRGARIAIPNDPTNGGRALLLLQAAGLIKVDPETGIQPTVFDITDNPNQLRFIELEAAQLTRSLPDVDAAVINGNYALVAGMVPTRDALFLEGSQSPYVNILAVRPEDKDNPALAALAEALTSPEVRDFILETYGGSVVPVF